MKQSKISTIQFNKEYTNSYWTTYFFDLTMENGDEWSIGKKKKDALVVGQNLCYELTVTEDWFSHIKEVKPEFSNSQIPLQTDKQIERSYGKNYKADAVSFALSYAKDCLVTQIARTPTTAKQKTIAEISEETELLADSLYMWMLAKYSALWI